MAARRADAYRRQDSVVINIPEWADHWRHSHVQEQWDKRSPDEWTGYSVRAAWREAQSAWSTQGGYARVHEESGMMLIAEHGVLQTAISVAMQAADDDTGQPDILERKYR